MGKVIAVANQKGGVGKTTTSVNLAASFADMGIDTLLIDMDPQSNATTGSGIERPPGQRTAYHWLQGFASFSDTCQDAPGGFQVIPSSGDLTAAELSLLSASDRNQRLAKRLNEAPSFPYTFVDCPPSLNVLTVNALTASTGVLIPMQCEYFALEGLSALISTLQGIRGAEKTDLMIDGIVRTMYDPRNSLTREVSRQLFDHFGDDMYHTVIPRNIRLAEAPSYGLPGLLYDPKARGTVAYKALAREMLARHQHGRLLNRERRHG